ncbi:MAG TPA: DUF3501 family protein [Steroidobacteraceae bacterium]
MTTPTRTHGARAQGQRKLRPEDLYSLEQYSRERAQFRPQVLAHKKRRTLQVGPNVTFCFEDRLTVQYQVQEMLRIERIFEAQGIADELAAYNPLIPDGSNWKSTLLIEYPDPEVRKSALSKLKGIEDRCWVRVAGHDPVFAVADEDLERENDEKTSAVHFLRFELTPAMVVDARAGAPLGVGIDHGNYRHAVEPVAEAVRVTLVADLA